MSDFMKVKNCSTKTWGGAINSRLDIAENSLQWNRRIYLVVKGRKMKIILDTKNSMEETF